MIFIVVKFTIRPEVADQWLMRVAPFRGMFGMRVKTGHSAVPLDCARTRFTICPTTERLTWPAKAA